jgi:hypothetical protein
MAREDAMHEAVNAQTCPLCGAVHTYKLAVETTPDPATSLLPLKKRRRKFAGAFPCPAVGKSYKGSATLLLTPGERISGVKVLGVEG